MIDAAKEGQLLAVDSEHSAIAQCLRGGSAAEVDRLILTASGGPFRGWSREQMLDVTPEQALAHPTWAMGRVITTNSATLVNKGLELLEAHLLYGVDLDRIDVVVHPQSIVHSMVQFVDGATLAQCSPPDMKLPIALALSWPDRLAEVSRPCDWSAAATWTFEPLDNEAFPAVELARECRPRRWQRARRSSTPPTRSASTPFTTGRSASATSPTSSRPCWPEHTSSASEAVSDGDVGSRLIRTEDLDLDRLLAADRWARPDGPGETGGRVWW